MVRPVVISLSVRKFSDESAKYCRPHSFALWYYATWCPFRHMEYDWHWSSRPIFKPALSFFSLSYLPRAWSSAALFKKMVFTTDSWLVQVLQVSDAKSLTLSSENISAFQLKCPISVQFPLYIQPQPYKPELIFWTPSSAFFVPSTNPLELAVSVRTDIPSWSTRSTLIFDHESWPNLIMIHNRKVVPFPSNNSTTFGLSALPH